MSDYVFNYIMVYFPGGDLFSWGPSSGTLTNLDSPDSTWSQFQSVVTNGNFSSLTAIAGSVTYPEGRFPVTYGDWDLNTGQQYFNVYANVPDPATYSPPSLMPTMNVAPFPVCYLEGSLIATPAGERAIETLAIGDQILTADGRAVPVKWIGRQQIRNSIFASPKLEPVCISAGALGNGLPHSDLYVTAAHGMIWHGMVVNAGAMVNGTTIRFVPLAQMPPVFTWYHIETEGHEEILAHGAPAETFVDYVGRSAFDNHQEYLDLYGAERIIPEMKRPRISTQRMLPAALRAQLGLPAHDAGIVAEANALLQRLKAA